MRGNEPFILVHVGAGKHNIGNKQKLKTLTRKACKLAFSSLLNSLDENEATEKLEKQGKMYQFDALLYTSYECLSVAAQVLESNSQTNCGHGSTLSSTKKVINDAHVLIKPDGKGPRSQQFALVGIENYMLPITRCLNFLMLPEVEDGTAALGVTKSCHMVDNGVDYYAKKDELGFPLLDDKNCQQFKLRSQEALRLFNYWDSVRRKQLGYSKDKVTDITNAANTTEIHEKEDLITDTVGILIHDKLGNVLNGACSGGNMLKPDGRIGCAGIVGAGSYIMNSEDLSFYEALIRPVLEAQFCPEFEKGKFEGTKETSVDDRSLESKVNSNLYEISLFASGNGEDIIVTDLSRYCCSYVLSHLHLTNGADIYDSSQFLENAMRTVLNRLILHAREIPGQETQKSLYAGVVGVVKEIDFGTRNTTAMYTIYAHTTETFVFALKTASLYEHIFSENPAPKKRSWYERTCEAKGKQTLRILRGQIKVCG